MPSIVRSERWFARVTIPHEFARSTINRVQEWIDLKQALVATHVGDRNEGEHIHLVIVLSSNLQKQSFDARLKAIYGVKGNANYSSKPWDGDDRVCSYLFHDPQVEIILNKGYTESDMERFRKLNDDVQKVIAINKERCSNRHVDKLVEWVVDHVGNKWTRYELFQEIMRRVREGEMYYPGDFQLKKIIEEVYIRTLDPDQFDAYLPDKFYDLYKS